MFFVYDERVYVRNYRLNGVNFKIVGKPNKVYENYGIVEEFKIARNNEKRCIRILKGMYQLALYCPYINTQKEILSLLNRETWNMEKVLYLIPNEAQEQISIGALLLYLKNSKLKIGRLH